MLYPLLLLLAYALPTVPSSLLVTFQYSPSAIFYVFSGRRLFASLCEAGFRLEVDANRMTPYMTLPAAHTTSSSFLVSFILSVCNPFALARQSDCDANRLLCGGYSR